MNETVVALLAGCITLVLSLLLPFVVRPVLWKLRIMDIPNERSSHERPVLRGLGLSVLIAMGVGGGAATLLLLLSPAPFRAFADGAPDRNVFAEAVVQAGQNPAAAYLLVVGLGSLLAGLLGLSEDLRGLSVPVRSAVLLGLALLTVTSLLWLARQFLGGVSFVRGSDWMAMNMPFWMFVVLAIYGVLFISSYINVANFMDGLNGISGFHGVIAGLAFAAGGAISGQTWLLVAGLVLAGGFGGFLPWNLSRRGAFLGDVGSYLLGGAVTIISFAAFVNGVPLLATIGPMVICFGDVGVTLVKRVREGKRWDEPHKEHVYQRIQQLGYSHVQASATTAGCTLLASVLGLCSFFTGLLGTLALLAAGLVVLAFYLKLPRLLPDRSVS